MCKVTGYAKNNIGNFVCMWHKVTMIVFTFINVNVHWYKIRYFVVLCLFLLLVDLNRTMCFVCLVLLVDLHRCMYSHNKSCVCVNHIPFMGKCALTQQILFLVLCSIYIPFMGRASVHWHSKHVSCSIYYSCIDISVCIEPTCFIHVINIST